MLNVDGVINGNYRCNLAGCDLNRKFGKNTSKILHPSVYYTKHLLKEIINVEKKPFFLYLDMHGHSVDKNVFQYGNQLQELEKPLKNALSPKLFPYLMWQQLDYFSFSNCCFKMPTSKHNTARISLFHQLRIPFVYTLEASFCGPNVGKNKDQHFSIGDLKNIGKAVLRSCWAFKFRELDGSNLLKQIQNTAEQ